MNWTHNKKILVTGSDGFIGRNLCQRLEEIGCSEVIKINRSSTDADINNAVNRSDFIFHLAGVNRPKDDNDFFKGNADLTEKIVNILLRLKKKTPVVLSSSTQAERDNAYGKSKLSAERILSHYCEIASARVYIYRLPNVFGKWCKPNYNSFVATFCHNIASGKDILINDANAKVTLVYIDDVCSEFISLLDKQEDERVFVYGSVAPVHDVTVGEVAELLYTFKDSRNNLVTEEVGEGFCRALYSTWLSYLSPEQFCYSIPHYKDQRGVFCEMLKTRNSGQFSFFTAHPGVTRGGHYHHSKNEKFLILQGNARFKFENILTGEKYEIAISADEYQIVETIPGWSHDITNIGFEDLIVMLWANEIFDKNFPDTFARALG